MAPVMTVAFTAAWSRQAALRDDRFCGLSEQSWCWSGWQWAVRR
ncbi:hypothetical protein [Micromonospora sp. NPDC005174]